MIAWGDESKRPPAPPSSESIQATMATRALTFSLAVVLALVLIAAVTATEAGLERADVPEVAASTASVGDAARSFVSTLGASANDFLDGP